MLANPLGAGETHAIYGRLKPQLYKQSPPTRTPSGVTKLLAILSKSELVADRQL